MNKHIFQSVLGLAFVAATAGLTGCSDPQQDMTDATGYKDVQACVADGNTQKLCQTVFDQAKAEHLRTAPRFQSQQDCEAEFGPGNCGSSDSFNLTASNGGGSSNSFFIPFMYGYMLGQNSSGSYARPIYHTYHNTYVTSEGESVGQTFGGKTRVSSSAVSKAPASSTLSHEEFSKGARVTVPASRGTSFGNKAPSVTGKSGATAHESEHVTTHESTSHATPHTAPAPRSSGSVSRGGFGGSGGGRSASP